ncbi:MAG TPA: transcription-repair coupling factor [Gemmatimonadaceae bacterium]|nr:transcription-repair coupling factor [Gemmatimonadaceae bacterium]
MALELLVDALEQQPALAELIQALPAPGSALRVTGLHGSSDAVLLAALVRRLPSRFFTVVAGSVPEAERWLADVQALLPADVVAFYPPREGLGEVEPHLEVAGERVETMERVSRGSLRVLLTTARAVLERTRVPSALHTLRLELHKGQLIRLSGLVERLEAMGFERVPMVEDVAQFSVRGGIVDVYGFGMADAVRAEFWGDEVVELRQFDLGTQRSTRDVDRVLVLPVDAPPISESSTSERTTLLSLLPPDTVLLEPVGTQIEPELARTWDEAQQHINAARRRGEDPAPRDDLFDEPDRVVAALGRFAALRLVPAGGAADVAFTVHAPEAVDRDIKSLRRIVGDGMPTVVLCDNRGQAERLEELLSDDGRAALLASLVVGVLQGGFVVPPAGDFRGLRVLTDHEVFRRERRIRRKRRYASGVPLDSAELRAGDFVVHLEHGVGIYRGMETMVVGQSTLEVAVVEYEGGDRLNVPLYRLDQLERYRSASDISEAAPPPRLHKLGGKRWAQQRDKTRAAIREMTVELLDLYARRKIATRPPHVPDTPWQKQLESSFLFEDTPDQRTATLAVKHDMESTRPMDRLLVGDVGYGKTEIAVRAAFKAVQSGRQVAVLVPTTILADQHYRTFTERLADFPVRVEVLSRFQNARQQHAIVADIAAHKVDIVIGTHRLLSPDVKFKELGLLVIDEEHRFGVKHKERLKQLRLETDVLTLTATPIPRTLHMSLAGLRDMTLMQTPPRDRSPVLTSLEPWDDGLIQEAIAREIDRGGQVFLVHNRIETIVGIADHVQRAVPRARLAVAHGQMHEHALETVMHQFVSGQVDVLVSTMIVESGLDVPNANTMFVNRADQFGLAQLYQLRGRVGRSHRRAYCYLLVPDAMDLEAERRLRVLEHHTELGAGYRIALRDMEMRGAGNLLGPEQSGFVQTVGFDLYLRLLDETVRNVVAGDAAPRLVPAEVNMDIPHHLPDEYIGSQDVKLDVYRRISRVTDARDLEALRAELRDRFGPLPPPAEATLALAELRLAGGALGVESILVRGNEARITFHDSAVPRMKGLSAAFHEVQFQAEVRRAHPLSLKLTRLGGASILDGLARALRGLV